MIEVFGLFSIANKGFGNSLSHNKIGCSCAWLLSQEARTASGTAKNSIDSRLLNCDPPKPSGLIRPGFHHEILQDSAILIGSCMFMWIQQPMTIPQDQLQAWAGLCMQEYGWLRGVGRESG